MPKQTHTKNTDETLQEFFEVRRLQEELSEKAKLRKQSKLLLAGLVYAALSLAIFSTVLPSSISTLFTNKLFVNSSSELQMIEFKESLLQLQKDNDSLKSLVTNLSTSTISVQLLDERVDRVETSQQNLYDSLLLKSDDIVTARLLTDKLNLQDEKINSLNEGIRRLDDSFSRIMWSVIILPILGIFGLIFREKLFGKNDSFL